MFSRLKKDCLLVLFLCLLVGCNRSEPGQIRGISVSPDGKFIAVTYVKGSTIVIYKVAMDTGIASRLTDANAGEESSPAFSADGKLIAYSYVPVNEHQRIMVMNVDGSNRRPLPGSDTANLYATFAPSGRTVYFARSQPPPHYHEWDIFSVGIDGSNLKQLTHEGFYHVSEPSLSPDGKSMVVLTGGLNTPDQIAVYSLDHPKGPKLSLRPHVPGEPGHPILAYPSYAPDGRSILFMAASDGKSGYDYDVYRLDLGTGALEKLTNANGFASDLRVFADGKTAVFLKWRKDWHETAVSSELYLLDLQTHKLTPFKVNGLN